MRDFKICSILGPETFSVLILLDRAGKGNTSFMSGLSSTGAQGVGGEGEEDWRGYSAGSGWRPLRSPFRADNGIRICRRRGVVAYFLILHHFVSLDRPAGRPTTYVADSGLFALQLMQKLPIP